MFEWMSDPQIWASLLTLTALEIVLGIDNILFISIVAGRLPPEQQLRARQIGLGLALIMRIALLSMLTWIIGLKEPVLSLWSFDLSWRDIILFGGGLFLLAKATLEIHHTVEGDEGHGPNAKTAAFGAVVGQIILLDIVFSLDSIITAVGMTDVLGVMIAAVVISIGVMLAVAGPVSAFVQRHPTVKMLALSFLLLIGMSLVAEGLHFHVPREYLYFAIAFSVLVEVLNLLVRRKATKKNGIPPVAPPTPGSPASH
jgi:predicted tellurium resistance membrane protein TerC